MSAPAGPTLAVGAPQPPAELGPLLDRVRALAGEPEAFTAAGPHRRADWLVGLLQLRDAVDAALTTALAAFDAAGDAATLHALSTATWLRAVARLAPGDATERVAIARATHGVDAALAEPHAALTAGRICYDQLRAIHHAVRTLPDPAQPQAVTLLDRPRRTHRHPHRPGRRPAPAPRRRPRRRADRRPGRLHPPPADPVPAARRHDRPDRPARPRSRHLADHRPGPAPDSRRSAGHPHPRATPRRRPRRPAPHRPGHQHLSHRRRQDSTPRAAAPARPDPPARPARRRPAPATRGGDPAGQPHRTRTH